MADDPNTLTISEAELGINDFDELSSKDSRAVIFLRAFVNSPDNVATACRASEVSRSTVERWRDTWPEFRSLFVRAREFGTECKLQELKEESKRRAMAGSDTLLIFEMKAAGYGRDKQTIEVVSPDVQQRLAKQADAIMQLCAMELPEPHKTTFAVKLAAALREVWT